MKHLLYEHQNNITELKAEGTVSMKLAQKDHRAHEMEMRKDVRTLKVELKEQELANEMLVKNLRLVGLPRGGPVRSGLCFGAWRNGLLRLPARPVANQRHLLGRNNKRTRRGSGTTLRGK